ncbi:MAG: ribosome-associated translation inhibitor RaiA [Erysipelotrichaceae bacterium]|jgi:putative sigma-54 modulation protein|nr:ribosome-associated translation inhibitor RaiA [Erysipelotrichaceae bacterium]
MKYQIIGKNIPVTDAISSTIKKKMSRMEKFFLINEEVECRAVISIHGQAQKIEITIFLPMYPLRAEVEHEDLYAAIDLAVDKLVGQMRKLKTRMERNNDRESFARNVQFLEDAENNKDKDEKDIIVRAKSYYLQPMKIEEAITRMEALGHDFFLYLDKDDDRVSVVYIRREGGYGVIQAENQIA